MGTDGTSMIDFILLATALTLFAFAFRPMDDLFDFELNRATALLAATRAQQAEEDRLYRVDPAVADKLDEEAARLYRVGGDLELAQALITAAARHRAPRPDFTSRF